ncbi:MAG: amidase, partial [Planctomycetaceae bacterium]
MTESSRDRTSESPSSKRWDRRQVLGVLSGLGIGTAAWQRALAAEVEQAGQVTPEMIQQAEWIAGLELTEGERAATVGALESALNDFETLRSVEVGYDVPPAVSFAAAPWLRPAGGVRRNQARPIESRAPQRPESDEDLAFLPVTELAALLRTRQVASLELVRLSLDRLKTFDPLLHCVM